MSNEIRADYGQVLMFPPCLEDWIGAEHPARYIREVVDQMDLAGMGFKVRTAEVGRPSYAVDLLLKVWLYGYWEGVRTSRKLEGACRKDVGLLWLTGMHYPDHNSLWRFMNENREAFKEVFLQTVRVAMKSGLVGMVLHALDGTKIQARGSTQKMWARGRLEKMLRKLEVRIEEIMQAAEHQERNDGGEYRLPEELADREKLAATIREKLAELNKVGREHMNPVEREVEVVKTTDGKRLGYNAQVVVDDRKGLIVAENVGTEAHDKFQLVEMIEEVERNVGRVADETVADGGYFSGEQLAKAEEKNYPVLVNLAEVKKAQDNGGAYHVSQFTYVGERDCWICPEGKELKYERTQYRSDRRYKVRIYRCQSFRQCPVRWLCSQDQNGRTVKLTPYAPAVHRQEEKQQASAKRDLLARRMSIVEPIFSWIKHLMHFRRWTVGGLEKVRAQWNLVCAVVNLKKMHHVWQAEKLRLA